MIKVDYKYNFHDVSKKIKVSFDSIRELINQDFCFEDL